MYTSVAVDDYIFCWAKTCYILSKLPNFPLCKSHWLFSKMLHRSIVLANISIIIESSTRKNVYIKNLEKSIDGAVTYIMQFLECKT